jgi:hypothetical protein
MINFNYRNFSNVPFQEIEDSKKAFIDKLGPFKDEFAEKNGTVTFDFKFPKEDFNRISFNLDGELYDFICRWNGYIRTLQ